MLKLVMMPPQNDLQRQWAPRLQRSLPDYRVVVPETGIVRLPPSEKLKMPAPPLNGKASTGPRTLL